MIPRYSSSSPGIPAISPSYVKSNGFVAITNLKRNPERKQILIHVNLEAHHVLEEYSQQSQAEHANDTDLFYSGNVLHVPNNWSRHHNQYYVNYKIQRS